MNKKKSNYFAENLKWLISKNNIKKVELSKQLGLSKSAISNYVSGVSVPKIETIRKIASIFGVKFEQLIDTDVSNPIAALNEDDKFVYTLPLFHNVLISEQVIYRNDNYIGNITSPVVLSENSECYAVMVRDDLMKNFGVLNGSIVIFDSTVKPENGDLSAVFIKSTKRILVRSVEFSSKKITISTADEHVEYKISKNECDAVVLGKVISATFNPNRK